MKRQVGEIYKEDSPFDSRNPWKVKFPKGTDGFFYVHGYPTKTQAKLGSQLAISIQRSLIKKSS